MNHDLVLNTVFISIYIAIAAILYVQYYLKPFKLEVVKLNTRIELRYWKGLKWYKACLIFSDKVQMPVITRNFTHFNFVLPLICNLKDIEQWLVKSEVHPVYFPQGHEELELLRAVLLGYITRDVDNNPLFKNKVNRLKILKAIRQNRHMLKEFINNLNPDFDFSEIRKSRFSTMRPVLTNAFYNYSINRENYGDY